MINFQQVPAARRSEVKADESETRSRFQYSVSGLRRNRLERASASARTQPPAALARMLSYSRTLEKSDKATNIVLRTV
ncbi:hypothetical protein EVAR_33580_1 [Eumeta japonica]|uniref:Uncharacterized protein n=1 Tax=Eumeta variegata TaxID=151549 RepID=A0A4C1VJQ7_EUMVA|nr:hypothetical protein EVAR_33580_1 [Eumeta japonica]